MQAKKIRGPEVGKQNGSDCAKDTIGTIYYLSPDGSDENPGTKEKPWATLNHASEQVQAGDTVILRPGSYEGTLCPKQDGTAEAPITFISEVRRGAVLIGEMERYAVDVEERHYLHFGGFVIRPTERRGGWMRINRSSHIVIDDVLMEEAIGRPFFINECEQIRVQNSDIRKQGFGKSGGDVTLIQHSKHIIFEGNAFSRGAHDLVLVYPDRTNEYIVFRGNVFHAAWTRTVLFDSVKNVLFEGNIITNSYDGAHNADSRYAFYVTNGIFRYNRIFGNWGDKGLVVSPYRETLDFRHIRIYHNAFHDNASVAVSIRAQANVGDAQFVNNIFYGNDLYGDGRQIDIKPSDLSGAPSHLSIRFENNAFSGSVGYSTTLHSLDQLQSPAWTRIWGEQFRNNIALTTDSERASAKDEPLRFDRPAPPTSPLVDSGRPLTLTVSSGEGNILAVQDARYFYDGFGIDGERGDLIIVGRPDQAARVIRVDSEAGLLYLDRHLHWNAGDPVSLPWTGNGPDIGVYEQTYADLTGRSVVPVIVSATAVHPGDEIELRVDLDEHLAYRRITWHLGDGNLAEGLVVRHAYAEPYDYPIRVAVETEDGSIVRGTGYVIVEPKERTDGILVHTTFGENDHEWWWRWKTYRPTPTAWERVFDGVTDGASLRVYAPQDNALLPARLHPAGWDIDEYPLIRMRYRINPGTPVGVYIEAFPTINGKPRVWVAATEVSKQLAKMPDDIADLLDDGEWHIIELDARAIRTVYPETKILNAIAWEAVSTDMVRVSDPIHGHVHGYWLDEVIIEADRNAECGNTHQSI